MIKKGFVTVLAFLLVFLALNFSNIVEARKLSSDTLEIIGNVSPFQQITVIQPVVVKFSYPWIGSEQGQALVLNDIGSLLVKSNSDWALSIGVPENHGFGISIRPANNRLAQWVPISGPTTVCKGRQGSTILSWDVKVEKLNHVKYQSSEQAVQFVFTISHI